MTTPRYCKNCGRELLYSLVGDFDTQTCAAAFIHLQRVQQKAAVLADHAQKLLTANRKLHADGVDYRRAIKELRADRERLIEKLQEKQIPLPKLAGIIRMGAVNI